MIMISILFYRLWWNKWLFWSYECSWTEPCWGPIL